MKPFLKIFSLTLLAVAFSSCQQPVTSSPGTGNGADGKDGVDGKSIEACPDGTLNCLIDDNQFTSQNDILQQLYDQCMTGCQADGGTLAQCQDKCDDILDTPSDAWESDQLKIPDKSMAVEVDIEACIDTNIANTLVFQGATASIPNYTTNQYQQMTGVSFLFGKGKRGSPVGMNLKCKVLGLYNKIKVNYTPVTETSVQIKNNPVTVVPFADGTKISRTYRSPHVTSFGIPYDIRSKMNVGQTAWLLKSAKAQLGIPAVVQFQHQNNDLGPLSLVHIFPPLHLTQMKFKLIFFAPAATP